MKKLFLLIIVVMLHAMVAVSMASPPDLTAGGVPNESPAITINLGPTGARGWAYHSKSDTSESRQILVTQVNSGSPAAGILTVNDVILGADGTGANPSGFSFDARKRLAMAIADAEARSPATLKLLRWRSGSTSTVTLTLQTMGAYSATAPYNCPKSAKILEDGMQYVYDHESAGRYSFGAITLLATGNATYQAKAQSAARGLIPSQYTMNKMMSDERDSSAMITWQRGHTLMFLTEYYLATNDAQVLPAIEAYAVNIAKNTSMFGTVGHIFAEKNADGSPNGPMGGVYGVVNTPGLFCFLGVLLAKECGLTNPEIDPAIERASRFFSYYSGKGAIPYGEHEPFSQQHENNGKCGLSALAFMLQDNRVEEGKFFAKMSTASANERELGHTGAFFNYVWAPLGAAAGGEEAAAAHFSRISWMLDLNRRWDGGFDYDCLNGEGPNSGSQYNDFRMSTAALLTYALPLRQLYITGKGHNPDRWLSSADVTEAIAAHNYNANSRSDSELIADLGNWSPKVRKAAGEKLGTRSISTSELSQITALANNKGGSSRAGACYALGRIGNSSSAATLAALLTDPDRYVRYMAGEAMRYLPSSAKLGQLNTILVAADTTSEPLYPMVEEDPLHFAHGRIAMLLFYSWSAYGPRGIIYNSVNGVDRNLLYPAIRAVGKTPIGLSRSTLEKTYDNLTYQDVLAVSGTIVDSITDRAPADKMFSLGVRRGGVATLHKFGIAEGVPACMIYAADEVGGKRKIPLEWLGTFGGSVYTVTPDPGTVPFLQSYLSDWEVGTTAQASIDAIAADTNPTTLTPLKSIQSVTIDDATVTLPANSTTLRVNAIDHAKGDSVYTWRKLSGPGGVTFTPNGTGAAVNTTVVLNGDPGSYQFEVTMSDSRGLTEVYKTVAIELEEDPGPDMTPPMPDPMTWALVPTPTVSSILTAGGQIFQAHSEIHDGKTWLLIGRGREGWQFDADGQGHVEDVSQNLKTSAAFTPACYSEAIINDLLDQAGVTMTDLQIRIRRASTTDGTGEYQDLRWYGFTSPAFTWAFHSGSGIPVTALLKNSPLDEDMAGIPYATSTQDNSSQGGNDADRLFTYSWSGHANKRGFGYGSTVQGIDNNNPETFLWENTTEGHPLPYTEVYLEYPVFFGNSEASIGMAATPATDVSDVEYYFECTAGPGHDSDWQDSPVYIDTNLVSEIQYTYTVTARDKSENQNATAPSAPASAVPCYIEGDLNADCQVDLLDFSKLTMGWFTTYHMSDLTLMSQNWLTNALNDPAPAVIGMTQADAQSAIAAAGFVVGTVTTAYSDTVAAGKVISQSPTAGTLIAAGLPVDILVSSGQ